MSMFEEFEVAVKRAADRIMALESPTSEKMLDAILKDEMGDLWLFPNGRDILRKAVMTEIILRKFIEIKNQNK